jgi:hypothetical protein
VTIQRGLSDFSSLFLHSSQSSPFRRTALHRRIPPSRSPLACHLARTACGESRFSTTSSLSIKRSSPSPVHSICGWFWLANSGTANFYMTAFDCNVSGSPADAVAIAAPADPGASSASSILFTDPS